MPVGKICVVFFPCYERNAIKKKKKREWKEFCLFIQPYWCVCCEKALKIDDEIFTSPDK
jgi:hypothetical protein